MLEWRAGTDLRADPRCQLNDYAVAEARIPRNVPTVINLGRHHGVDVSIVGCDRGPKGLSEHNVLGSTHVCKAGYKVASLTGDLVEETRLPHSFELRLFS